MFNNTHNILLGHQNPDGTIIVPVKMENPITNKSVIVNCLVDTGASNVVLAESDLNGEDLGMLFSDDDIGTSTIANGKKAVAPVHMLCVTTGIEGYPRRRPILHVPISQGKHSLLGMSYLNGIRANIDLGDGKIMVAKRWDGLDSVALGLITTDNDRLKILKQKYEKTEGLRKLNEQRKFIEDIINKKNSDSTDKQNKLVMMSFIEDNITPIGLNLGAIGPASTESHTVDITIPNTYLDQETTSKSLLIENDNDNIGINLGRTSYY